MSTPTATPDTILTAYAQPPQLTQFQALQAVSLAAARVRHAVEQGNGIARYEAWRDMCAALDHLGIGAKA